MIRPTITVLDSVNVPPAAEAVESFAALFKAWKPKNEPAQGRAAPAKFERSRRPARPRATPGTENDGA